MSDARAFGVVHLNLGAKFLNIILGWYVDSWVYVMWYCSDHLQSLRTTVIVGSQWGDEGKGKLVDLLSADFGIILNLSLFSTSFLFSHIWIYFNDKSKTLLHVAKVVPMLVTPLLWRVPKLHFI